ncbi:hypothetical protein D3D03_16325 [Exiguobacterium sp. RIT452]|nr:hypothetical protein D3D03_16325 [Exiguobacterium sp. RIT452]
MRRSYKVKFINDCDSVLNNEINSEIMKFDRNSFFNNIEELPVLQNKVEMNSKTDLVIIGTGMVGITLAARAWHLGFKGDRITLIDGNEYFAENFFRRTKNSEQKIMRSSFIHHVAPNEDINLADFTRLKHNELTNIEKEQLTLARMGERSLPSLDIFLEHVKHVVINHNLHKRAFKFSADSIEQNTTGKWIISDSEGQKIESKYVVLAMGQSPKENMYKEHSINAHVDNFKNYLNEKVKTVNIIGGGNTSAHIVKSCLDRNLKVNWIIRNEENYACTDIPHKYWRDEGYLKFSQMTLDKRMEEIKRIYKGSAMLEHKGIFDDYKKDNALTVFDNATIQEIDKNKTIILQNKTRVESDLIISTIGFELKKLPQIKNGINTFNGFPVLNDSTLEAEGLKNLFIASSHSALSLGPAAKNIDGARIASERIFKELAKREGIEKYNVKNILENLTNWSRNTPVLKK